MPIDNIRTIKCDICGKEEAEKEYGVGWKGWSIVQGIAYKELEKPDDNNSSYCPPCTVGITEYINRQIAAIKEG